MPSIDRESPTAIYQQIANELRHDIKAGRYPPGSRLPSETDLMHRFGVARMTARKAVKVLADEGLAQIVRGRGAWVIRAAA